MSNDPMRDLTPLLDADEIVDEEFLEDCLREAERDFSEIRSGIADLSPSAHQLRAERMVLLVARIREMQEKTVEVICHECGRIGMASEDEITAMTDEHVLTDHSPGFTFERPNSSWMLVPKGMKIV